MFSALLVALLLSADADAGEIFVTGLAVLAVGQQPGAAPARRSAIEQCSPSSTICLSS